MPRGQAAPAPRLQVLSPVEVEQQVDLRRPDLARSGDHLEMAAGRANAGFAAELPHAFAARGRWLADPQSRDIVSSTGSFTDTRNDADTAPGRNRRLARDLSRHLNATYVQQSRARGFPAFTTAPSRRRPARSPSSGGKTPSPSHRGSRRSSLSRAVPSWHDRPEPGDLDAGSRPQSPRTNVTNTQFHSYAANRSGSPGRILWSTKSQSLLADTNGLWAPRGLRRPRPGPTARPV